MNIELIPVARWSEIAKFLKGSQSEEQIPNPENSVMLSAFDGERMVGCIGAEKAWIVSPFEIEKDHRGTGLAQRLALTLMRHNTQGFREMLITTNPHVDRMVFDLGFVPLEGQLWRRNVGK